MIYSKSLWNADKIKGFWVSVVEVLTLWRDILLTSSSLVLGPNWWWNQVSKQIKYDNKLLKSFWTNRVILLLVISTIRLNSSFLLLGSAGLLFRSGPQCDWFWFWRRMEAVLWKRNQAGCRRQWVLKTFN